MTDDSTPEGTVEQAEPVATADSLLDRFLGSSDEEDTPQELEDSTEDQASEEDAVTDLSADDAGQDDDAEQQEGDHSQEEASAGRFVGDDGKVRLPDGTVTTVAELKRGSRRISKSLASQYRKTPLWVRSVDECVSISTLM